MWYPPCRPSCLLAAAVSVPWGDVGCGRPALRTVGRFASLPCLLNVYRRMPRRFAPSSVLVFGCVPPSAFLGSCFFSLRPVIGSCGSCAGVVQLRLAPRPASSTRRAGRYDSVAAALDLLACPSARHLIHAVRHRMATGFGACPVRLLPACPPPHGHHRCRLLDPLAQSDLLIASLRLPSPITRHGGRGGIHLRGFCECGGGGCLACLDIILCILLMGDVVARRCVSGL